MKTLIYSIFYFSVVTAVGYLAYSNSNSKTWFSNLFSSESQVKSTQEMLIDITKSINEQFQTLQQKNEIQSKTIALLKQQMKDIKVQVSEMMDINDTKISSNEQNVVTKAEGLAQDKKTEATVEDNKNTQQQDIQAIAQRKMSLREIADKMNMKALNNLNPG